MIDIADLLNLQGELFLLLAAGFFFRKRVVGDGFEKGLTDVILYLILPCNIVTSYYNIFTVRGTAASRVFFRIVAKAVRMGALA